jgi:hypothetical protein
LRGDADRPWIDVARVTNLAEAGFLTDELVGFGVDARIHQLDEFSALTDRWASVYLIRVPSEWAHEAAAQIRRHLAEDSAGGDGDTRAYRFATEDYVDPTFWRPVALVVLAGVASFILGQQFSDNHGQRRPPRDSLPSAVDAIGRPLVTEPIPGQPRHRLMFDRRRGTWHLDVDQDADGVYDSRRRFQATGARM